MIAGVSGAQREELWQRHPLHIYFLQEKRWIDQPEF
jgi:hypothetical protein